MQVPSNIEFEDVDLPIQATSRGFKNVRSSTPDGRYLLHVLGPSLFVNSTIKLLSILLILYHDLSHQHLLSRGAKPSVSNEPDMNKLYLPDIKRLPCVGDSILAKDDLAD